MPCVICKGRGLLEDKPSIFTTVIEDCVLIVKNVPSQVCRQCGETYYDDEVAARLEQIVKVFRSALTEIAVVNYQDRVA